MNKREVLRLKPGTVILYNEACPQRQRYRSEYLWVGKVVHVTSNGGVKVSYVMPYKSTKYSYHGGWCGSARDVEWVPYQRVMHTLGGWNVGKGDKVEERRDPLTMTWDEVGS
jgi:hypothetical protein